MEKDRNTKITETFNEIKDDLWNNLKEREQVLRRPVKYLYLTFEGVKNEANLDIVELMDIGREAFRRTRNELTNCVNDVNDYIGHIDKELARFERCKERREIMEKEQVKEQ